MKKKIITITVAASMLMAGIAGASSLWGSYKGNDIIRIVSDGVPLTVQDVPAISYNDRTMIPISMLGQVGLSYNWDQKNKTVSVSAAKSNEGIKTNVRYARFYNNLRSLGDSLTRVSSNYYTAADYLSANSPSFQNQLNNAATSLDAAIKFYNASVEEAKNYSNSEINTILNSYYDAIDHFKVMDTSFQSFVTGKKAADLSTFTSSNVSGITKAAEGAKLANQMYNHYMDAALK